MQRRRRYVGIVVAVGVAAAVAAVGGAATLVPGPKGDNYGTKGDDKIVGNDKVNVLKGDTGSDEIYGMGHNDTVAGEDGRDKLAGNDGNDNVGGGNGDDYDVQGGPGDDEVYGGPGDDGKGLENNVGGGDGNDNVYGNEGNDWVFGGPGDDNVYGNDGDDQIWPGTGRNVAAGGSGTNGFHSEGLDTLTGGDGIDWFDLTKTSSGTSVNGGAGADLVNARTTGSPDPVVTIDCGAGADVAYVTANDVVSNCETVDRIGVASPAGSAPVIATLTAPASTSGGSVAATVNASDPDNDITHVRVTTFGLPWGEWVAYSSSVTITLSEGVGAKAVIAQVRDSKGRESNVGVASVTRTAAPVIISVTAPSSTSTTSVAVHVNATDADSAIDKIRVAAGGAAWSDWKSYGPDLSVTLPSSLGAKTIYVQVRDANGGDSNVGSVVVTRVAASTTTPPGKEGGGSADTPTAKDKVKPRIVSMKLPASTCTRAVTLKLRAMDNRKVVKMRIAVKGSKYGSWRAYKATSKVTLPKGTGGKAVRVQVRDAAGNVSKVSLRRTSLKACSSS